MFKLKLYLLHENIWHQININNYEPLKYSLIIEMS